MELPTHLAIGALSQRTGCQVETIRYYEQVGLLPRPPRTPGGYRQYGPKHLARLAFIRRARALGFSLGEVRRLLHLADERRRPCAEARVLAAAHLADVRAKIADLRRMEHVLADTVARCAAGTGAECALIDALSSESGPTTAVHRARRFRRTRGPEWRIGASVASKRHDDRTHRTPSA